MLFFCGLSRRRMADRRAAPSLFPRHKSSTKPRHATPPDFRPASAQNPIIVLPVGALATEHLVQQRCRRSAHVRGPSLSISAGRARGYIRTLRRHRLAVRENWVVEAGYVDTGEYSAMQQQLAEKVPLDGISCFNDPVAIGATRAIFEAGLAPCDIAVVGVANMHYADLVKGPLATVDQGAASMGDRAA